MSDPEQIIIGLKLQPGMHVADLGAGSGFYTFAAASAVGAQGKVYAVDVLKDMLLKIRSEARDRRVANIEIVWGNMERIGGTKLADGAVDAVVIANTLFQIEDKRAAIEEIKRILKPKGKLLLVDWSESFGGMGPMQDNVVTKEKARNLFEQGGFMFREEIPAGEHHYSLIFRKA